MIWMKIKLENYADENYNECGKFIQFKVLGKEFFNYLSLEMLDLR